MRCTEEQLRQLYLDKGLSSNEIARQLAIPRPTISWELKRFSIPLRHAGAKKGKHYSPATEFQKGIDPWNKGATKQTDPRIMAYSFKVSVANRGRRHTEEWRINTSKRLKGRSYSKARYAYNKEFYENLYYKEGLSLGTIARKIGCDVGTVVYYFKKYGIPRRNRTEAVRRKPTEPERKLSEIMERYNLPFKYVGNGKVIIDKLCPDFINTDGNKQIVELFGDYWHTGAVKRWGQFEGGRIYHYAKFGFETLIIWENELSNESKVARKIKQFARRKVKVS